MKERPILFSGPMVLAIFEGRKTMTRRVIKPKPWEIMSPKHGDPKWPYGFKYFTGSDSQGEPFPMKCPYGQPSDRLWVRETFAPRYFDNGKPAYRADWTGKAADLIPEPRWKPSIFMPHKLSSILLEVTAVRVERVQDISSRDSWNEGATCSCTSPVPQCAGNIEAFRSLWDSINAKRGYGWDTNPWVWVVEFKKAAR